MNNAIPILLYHRIDGSALSTATRPAVFKRHLQWLAERKWHALTADEFTYGMRTGKPVPPRSFVITFDDGYESIASTALPILKEYNFPAIAFISTRLVRDTETTDSERPGAQQPPAFLSWDQARALQSGGLIDLQSHSHSHKRFADWSLTDIATDLTTSVDILSQRLALPRNHFTHLAWPWGESTPAWRNAAVRAGFRYQYTVARRSCQATTPLDEIPRTCFDATNFLHFQWQFWLQSGQLSTVWNVAYPYGRRLRQFANLRG
ncbi:polysaccharide deacetylase family protein [Noviherbaspirillum agri]